MPYNQSDYDTAIAAFNTLPETMAVENLISIRQRNEQGALQIDKMKSEMKKDQEELDGFAAFNDEVNKRQIDYSDPEATAKSVAELKGKFIGNKKAQEAADALLQSSASIQAGKRSKFESKNLDEEEANRVARNDLQNREWKLRSGQIDEAQKNLDILITDNKSNIKSNFSNLNGQLRANHMDVGEAAAKWIERYGEDEKMLPHIREAGKLISNLIKADGLESINSTALQKLDASVLNLKLKGVDLNPDLPPEALQENYKKAKSIYPVGSKEYKSTEEMINNHRAYYDSIRTRKVLADKLVSFFNEAPDISTDVGMKEYTSKLAGISYRLADLGGRVDKDYADREAAQKLKEQSDAEEKKRLEFSKLSGEIKNASDTANIRKLVAFSKINGVKREVATEMLKLSLGKDGKATPEKIQAAKELLDKFDSEFGLDEAPKSILD
jgi:hypothetical protein